MLFNSIVFLLYFLPLTLLLYFAIPRILRNTVLLLASLFFYAWGETSFVLLMLLSIIVNYGFGLAITRYRETGLSRFVLFTSAIFNIGLLAYFKYASFALDSLNAVVHVTNNTDLDLHLPIGISFFTFQVMSYVIDVYRGTTPVQRNPLNLGLFISFFPQLIAGPIVRYKDVNEQLVERHVTLNGFSAGIRRFVIGLGKKVLIANNVAVVADSVFALDPSNIGSALAWIGVLCYSIQIYFDFAGYSDMAIGLGMMFGFRFPENFNFPYISTSIRGFWRRWHITLSNWFRDYVYISLGGNRGRPARTYLNLYIVFFLTGLWHGASWTFVIWGLLHGTFMVIERIGFGAFLERLWQPLQHIYTLLVVVMAWVFFRADTLDYALDYIWRLWSFSADTPTYPLALYLTSEQLVALILGVILSMPLVPALQKRWPQPAIQEKMVPVLQFVTTTIILLLSMSYIASGAYSPFIYFRF